jgi:hypothetical protein
MRRRRRQLLLRSFAVFSALLCVITAILWLRCGDMASDEAEVTWQRGYGIHSLEGRLFFSIFWNPQYTTPRYPSFNFGRDYNESAGFWSYVVMFDHGRVAGPFGIASVDLRPVGDAIRPDVREIMIPHWFVIGVFALAPVGVAVAEFVRWRRRRAGCCAKCGYDLRASSDRCPECGSLVSGDLPFA